MHQYPNSNYQFFGKSIVIAIVLSIPSPHLAFSHDDHHHPSTAEINLHLPEELIKLGWTTVDQARRNQDEFIYHSVLAIADQHDSQFGPSPDSRLLRGHALLQFHRFAETESVARYLVRIRSNSADYALLGDALLEQGKLAEAEANYLRMARKNFGYQSLIRLAWLKWRQGKQEASLNLWQQAFRKSDQVTDFDRAWCATKVAEAYLALGERRMSAHYVAQALSLYPNYKKAQSLRDSFPESRHRHGT